MFVVFLISLHLILAYTKLIAALISLEFTVTSLLRKTFGASSVLSEEELVICCEVRFLLVSPPSH
jgi:hypothetical protein